MFCQGLLRIKCERRADFEHDCAYIIKRKAPQMAIIIFSYFFYKTSCKLEIRRFHASWLGAYIKSLRQHKGQQQLQRDTAIVQQARRRWSRIAWMLHFLCWYWSCRTWGFCISSLWRHSHVFLLYRSFLCRRLLLLA